MSEKELLLQIDELKKRRSIIENQIKLNRIELKSINQILNMYETTLQEICSHKNALCIKMPFVCKCCKKIFNYDAWLNDMSRF